MQNGAVLEGQVSQAKVYANQRDYTQVARLNKTHNGEWALYFYWCSDLDHLVASLFAIVIFLQIKA